MADETKPEASEQPTLYTLWDKYEEAAKHFNDLNMRWRLQAMGGMVTLSTLAGFIVGGQDTIASRLRAMIIFSGMLLAAWIAIVLLDLLYYNELLYGAGTAIRELEDQTKAWPVPIQLSTHLDAAVFRAGRTVPKVFYGLGFFPLAIALGWASCAYRSLPDREKALINPTPCASAQPTTTSGKK